MSSEMIAECIKKMEEGATELDLRRILQWYTHKSTFKSFFIIIDKYIGDEEVKEIAEALKTNTTLTKIDLPNNNWSGFRGLRDYNDIGDEGAKVLAEALKINTTVTEINLEGNSNNN